MSRTTPSNPAPSAAPAQVVAARYLDLWEANIALVARSEIPATPTAAQANKE